MRCRRAELRREKKYIDKLMKKAPNEEVWLERGFIAGKNEGMSLATGIIFLALCEEYGFGKKRIERLIDRISKESMKMDEDATKFNVNWYMDKLHEKCGIRILGE